MAFDGFITVCVVSEVNKTLLNSRIEKIHMPTKNDIVFITHNGKEKLKLLISIDPSNARFHLTWVQKENPVKAPGFCMVLRKYLQGSKITAINQYGLDRVISIEFENINELGDLVKYRLYIELMGKYSNLILVNDNNKILDSMKHVDFTMSSVREVLPARDYVLPNNLGKQEFLGMTYDSFIANIQLAGMDPYFSHDNMSKIIANQFVGFSKTFMDNLLSYAKVTDNFNKENTLTMYNTITLVLHNISQNMINLKNFGNDYHIDLSNFTTSSSDYSTSLFLDNYYKEKEDISALKTNRFNLLKDINGFKSKYTKNLKRVEEILAESQNMEKYKLYGELISANIYRISPGLLEITLENYYDNNNPITIPLNLNLSPSRNAQAYFKKYNKLKNSISHANEQKEDYLKNIDYLDSVIFLAESANSIEELNEIKEELKESGYKNYAIGKKKYSDEVKLPPITYNVDGYTIKVGRNNLQNDKLTLKDSKKSYTWLHTKDVHGSHVIIESEEDEIPAKVLEEAGRIAVEHSKAKGSSKVSVDYTKVKFVHKPSGSKPGKVIYTDYKTIVID